MVYLICFDRPFHHAHHYIGFCDGQEESLEARIDRHKRGDGSKLLRTVTKAGIGWRVVRTWPDGNREFERRLKNWHKARELCPICRERLRQTKLEALRRIDQAREELAKAEVGG